MLSGNYKGHSYQKIPSMLTLLLTLTGLACFALCFAAVNYFEKI